MFAITYFNKQRICGSSAVHCPAVGSVQQKAGYYPETFKSPEDLYKDEQGAIGGVTGIYRKMLELNNGDYYFVGIVGTDEGKTSSFVPTWGGYWQHYDGINSYNKLLTAQNQLVQGAWNSLYKGIINANTAIRYIPSSIRCAANKRQVDSRSKVFARHVLF